MKHNKYTRKELSRLWGIYWKKKWFSRWRLVVVQNEYVKDPRGEAERAAAFSKKHTVYDAFAARLVLSPDGLIETRFGWWAKPA